MAFTSFAEGLRDQHTVNPRARMSRNQRTYSGTPWAMVVVSFARNLARKLSSPRLRHGMLSEHLGENGKGPFSCPKKQGLLPADSAWVDRRRRKVDPSRSRTWFRLTASKVDRGLFPGQRYLATSPRPRGGTHWMLKLRGLRGKFCGR